MIAIDFGFDDNKINFSALDVHYRNERGETELITGRAVSIRKSSLWPSGWGVGVDGVYAWDAATIVDNWASTWRAGPYTVSWKCQQITRKLMKIESLFTPETDMDTMRAALANLFDN